MQCARLDIGKKYWDIWKPKWKDLVLLNNTVHDDIEMDVDNKAELVYNICIELRKSFQDIPKSFKKRYGVEMNVPMDGECKFGYTLAEETMTKFNEKTFEEDFYNVYKKD